MMNAGKSCPVTPRNGKQSLHGWVDGSVSRNSTLEPSKQSTDTGFLSTFDFILLRRLQERLQDDVHVLHGVSMVGLA
jgi:hypothetical protein